jgi:hypothetical protein
MPLPALECRACGGKSDAISHLLGGTCFAEQAKEAFGRCIGYDLHHQQLGAPSSWQAALLLFRTTHHRTEVVNAVVVFNYAVWLAQIKQFRALPTLPSQEQATTIIVRIAVRTWANVRSPKWHDAHNMAGAILTVAKQGFGSSSNRTAEDRARARAEAVRLISALPDHTAIGFSDGSAIPNPAALRHRGSALHAGAQARV